MLSLLNNKFFVIFLAPFLLGALATLGFSPYNFTFINFFSFSILLFLISIIKKTKTKRTLFLVICFWRKRKGMQNKVIEIKLREYTPIKDSIWITSIDHDQVYEIKFHGNPVNKFPLKNSKIEKTKEKNKIKDIFFSEKGPITKIASPKNKERNKGINIIAKGITPWNISSCVKDIEIQ